MTTGADGLFDARYSLAHGEDLARKFAGRRCSAGIGGEACQKILESAPRTTATSVGIGRHRRDAAHLCNPRWLSAGSSTRRKRCPSRWNAVVTGERSLMCSRHAAGRALRSADHAVDEHLCLRERLPQRVVETGKFRLTERRRQIARNKLPARLSTNESKRCRRSSAGLVARARRGAAAALREAQQLSSGLCSTGKRDAMQLVADPMGVLPGRQRIAATRSGNSGLMADAAAPDRFLRRSCQSRRPRVERHQRLDVGGRRT